MKIYKDSVGLHVLHGIPNNEMMGHDIYIEKIIINGEKYETNNETGLINIKQIRLDEKGNYGYIEWETGEVILTTNPITIYSRKR
jgi:hypothetical protein